MQPEHFDVAVIGFGPCGAVATALLGAAGLTTLAIDRVPQIYPLPRAMAVDHEIMRLFDNLGVADEILKHTAPFSASQHFGAQGQLIRRIDMVPPPYPMGYTPSMVFTQPPVEAILRQRATEMPCVTVQLGTELVGIAQDADRVTLHMQADGTTRSVTAGHVVACDGASSFVRQHLGMTLDDLVFDEPWIVIDVKVAENALGKLPQTSAQFCNPARPTTFLIGPANHRRWEIMLLPGEDPKTLSEPDAVWRLLAPWITPQDGTLWRSATYRFHALVAHDWRQGRVFLAGDAAHQQPPFIGQGMCQGLRDVSNLIWKLSDVVAGKADPSLLDTYGTERGAHVRALTSRIKAIGEIICERDPMAAAARDIRILAEGGGQPRTVTRQEIVPGLSTGLLATEATPARGILFPQPLIATLAGPVLLDRIAGHGWRLVLDVEPTQTVAERAHQLGLRIISIGPGADLEETQSVLAAWFTKHACNAAIVRPDHYVFGTATDPDGICHLLDQLAPTLKLLELT